MEQIYREVEDIIEVQEENKYRSVTFLDFAQAFKKVWFGIKYSSTHYIYGTTTSKFF